MPQRDVLGMGANSFPLSEVMVCSQGFHSSKVLMVASYTCSAVLLFRSSILTIPVALQLIVSSTPLSHAKGIPLGKGCLSKGILRIGMVFANDCIDFQVAKSVFLFHNSRSLFNVYSIDNQTSMVFKASSFPIPFTSMSQVFKEASSSLFILPDVLIYPFC